MGNEFKICLVVIDSVATRNAMLSAICEEKLVTGVAFVFYAARLPLNLLKQQKHLIRKAATGDVL